MDLIIPLIIGYLVAGMVIGGSYVEIRGTRTILITFLIFVFFWPIVLFMYGARIIRGR